VGFDRDKNELKYSSNRGINKLFLQLGETNFVTIITNFATWDDFFATSTDNLATFLLILHLTKFNALAS
jgi:hypothetical protein